MLFGRKKPVFIGRSGKLQRVGAGMGEPFFYSTEHMSEKYARALAKADEYTD